jgi:hypothetical protein
MWPGTQRDVVQTKPSRGLSVIEGTMLRRGVE